MLVMAQRQGGEHLFAILEHLFGLDIEAGRKVVISLYDDDAFSDVVWNTILSARVNLDVTADLAVTKGIPVAANASGSVQLLDRSVTLDSADYLRHERTDSLAIARIAFGVP